MEMPMAFRTLCSYFLRGMEEGYSSGEEMLRDAVARLTPDERVAAEQYFDHILDGRYDDDKLERVWHDAGAELRIMRNAEGDVAGLLAMLRSALAS